MASIVTYFNIQLFGVKKMINNAKIKLECVVCPKSHNGLFKIANYIFYSAEKKNALKKYC
jgi:hypothetical protein